MPVTSRFTLKTMTLLKRIFGRRKHPLVQASAAVNDMGNALIAASGLKFDHASQLEQALIGTFFFGMAYAHGRCNKLSPPQIHALALKAYMEIFHYTPEAAAQAAQACIDASAPGGHDTMNTILHRGIDGHAQFTSGNVTALAENIRLVLMQFQK